MVKTVMPRDDNSLPIPVLRFREGGAHSATITSSAHERIALGSGVRVITVSATYPIFFETGDSDVEATSSSHYLTAGIPYDMALGSGLSGTQGYHTHISILAVSTTSKVYISERE